ncbi:glycosyltransferase family 2 protein [Candidatus Berkelbacteria bacterium]|nr:glycosyltransferase family 2 protein [Candidatus Berkelbacteria bacterium]
MKLSVIIPVYNEQATLVDILERVKRVPFSKEIIVINDGSIDQTKKILRSYAREKDFTIVTFPKNQGKGAAVRKGIELAKSDYVVIQDADLEYDPTDWKKLLTAIRGGARVVYGSRFMGAYQVGLANIFHYLANRLLTGLTNLLYGSRLTDMETAYKLIERKLAQSLGLISDRFEIEPELTAKILKKGIKIHEVPISYAGRQYHEGKKITWRDGLTSLWAIVYHRFFN